MSGSAWRKDVLATPLGELIVIQDDDGVARAMEWAACAGRLARHLHRHHQNRRLCDGDGGGALLETLARYFDGAVDAIDALELRPAGTPFQQQVWAALRDIPCGTTQTYGALARRFDPPTAPRAVGAANGANPISVALPCHRLVAHDGRLTGYAGGLARKGWLLRHERRGEP
ncbi:MAG: methylated-DNA--[protein]-cysteine S-methyltransferase [Gammaproteobacteria bacterium]